MHRHKAATRKGGRAETRNRASQRKQYKPRTARHAKARQVRRNQEARTRGLAAINRVRKGKSKTLSEAARGERTTVQSIKRLFPRALLPPRFGERLRVRKSDRYSQLVQIMTDLGNLVDVTARGSRERDLAGQHRAAYLGVLKGNLPDSILRKFRGKKVGGLKLLTNPKRLFELAHGGEIENLVPLYVNPEASV